MGCLQRKAQEEEKEMREGGRGGGERVSKRRQKEIAHCCDFHGSASLQP